MTALRLIVWNIARRDEPWRQLLDTDADVALLQEAAQPPKEVARLLDIDQGPWRTSGPGKDRPWRTAIVRLSDHVSVESIQTRSIDEADESDLAVSRMGTLSAAAVTGSRGESLVVASMYGVWESPHVTTDSGWIYADASAHRLVSDLSNLVGQQRSHRIVAAGDLNILHGYGDHGSAYWASRYATVFDRMTALGLAFVGPQTPSGRHADPWPKELPTSSANVPTYHTTRQTPATATRQLDFVFASRAIAKQVRATALNEVADWGPSDHCRIDIEVAWTP